jgi:hypothetical protein
MLEARYAAAVSKETFGSEMANMRPLVFLAALVATAGTGAAGQAPLPEDAPHLLNCSVKDTVRLDGNGALVKEAPLPPGARAIGRVTGFVVDTVSGVVRIPGLGDIAWIMVKGRGLDEPEIIVTPATRLDSATSISIHIHRTNGDARFVFFEVDRIMSGTCQLLP